MINQNKTNLGRQQSYSENEVLVLYWKHFQITMN